MDNLSDSEVLDTPPVTTSPLKVSTVSLHADSGVHEEDIFNNGSLNLSAGEKPTDLETSTISRSQEQTRARIAWVFTQIFLLVVVITLVLPTVVNIGFPRTFADPVETSKTLLTTMASVLAGPFGFIVGFYFKKGEG